ncbi:MAG: S-layer homology domain-containing protein [Peptococcaceae bacterium]|nr:S-layer homology domain-containing protein [Peptococcaceae bacterium]
MGKTKKALIPLLVAALCLVALPAAAMASDTVAATAGESTLDGVKVTYSIDDQGEVSLAPAAEAFQELLAKAENGDLIIALKDITGMTGVKVKIDLKSLLQEENLRSFTFSVNDLTLKVPVGALERISVLADTVNFGLRSGSLIFTVTDEQGEPIDYIDNDHPIFISQPYSLQAGEDPALVTTVHAYADGPRVVPRSWYDDGRLYAKVYSTGRYDAWYGGGNPGVTGGASAGAAALDYLAAREVINNNGTAQITADSQVTRGQFIDMLLRALDIEPQGAWMVRQFSDVDADAFYYESLLQAKALGMAAGVGDNRFAPETGITRQEMYVMLYKGLAAANLLPEVVTMQWIIFSDWDNLSSYAGNAIQNLAKFGLVPNQGGELRPRAVATGAEAAAALRDMLVWESGRA